MASIIRADTDQMRNVARQMRNVAEQVTNGSSTMHQSMNTLDAVWSGQARDRGMQAWSQIVVKHNPIAEELIRMAHGLEDLAQRLDEIFATFGGGAAIGSVTAFVLEAARSAIGSFRHRISEGLHAIGHRIRDLLPSPAPIDPMPPFPYFPHSPRPDFVFPVFPPPSPWPGAVPMPMPMPMPSDIPSVKPIPMPIPGYRPDMPSGLELDPNWIRPEPSVITLPDRIISPSDIRPFVPNPDIRLPFFRLNS
ncbi:WXG100 family type VII secretion target [Candidatus Viridilinea mediisalina]|uniref:Uncharacterized protein n=1 Tax=Candidatus Viridilinea mediisalina TaxID=2024553 RepID=A0A2A6RG01_9CHLR|nr:WXG100 family type VII secretion target [Candidatus Viridilinea mediisalina]PDW01816.1 hypothetical protein CJ255_17165 [Candidatus Viridilinea mediisalina]